MDHQFHQCFGCFSCSFAHYFSRHFHSSDSTITTRLAIDPNLACSIRLFAVVRYDSVFHEYDPYFNYRATVYLVKEGFSDFMNWIDSRTWYPMGRLVGQTVYPGLMSTAAILNWTMAYLGLPTNVRNTYVYLAPMLSGINSWFTYLLTSEV
jgi:dolichyl-diphosphooligosaccharide--protein glycosyltransferase